MTDTSSDAVTHSTADANSVTAPLPSPALNGAVSDSLLPEEEEPYTIKCICAFVDDDGNTVFCEKCETWQHIECYYHGRSVPDEHNCVDCEPRLLDSKRATERQRRLREQGDGGDRRSKRPGSKSQKKKSRDYLDQPNGFHQRTESGSRDQPPSKRTKTGHRPSASVSSLPGTFSLPPDARKRSSISTHPQSPTKPSAPSIPLYSNEFLHLYDRDQGHADMDSNLFVNIHLAAELASWVTDATALSRVTNGRSAREIFTWSDTALDRSHWPDLSTELVTDDSIDLDGLHPTWKILKTEDTVRKDGIVGEVTGKIGLLRDYCLDPGNRWQELHHPEPFVFFHPQLPIYIDSRQEGSLLRYVRRSCRPNVTLKTYITNEVEYHFCLVAKEDIPANTEVTAMWYLDPQLFESLNGFVKQEFSDSAQEVAAVCLSNVLSHFGGCACASDPPQLCLLSSIDRRRLPRSVDLGFRQSNGKRKRTKRKSTVSPVGIGRAVSSRAGSEGTKNMDDDDQADSRSSSGSAQGHTRSRDLSPSLQTPNDFMFGESELSARDKRKIAAAEKKFQQLEQGQQAFQRRKKRNSGQSAQAMSAAGSSTQTGYFGNFGASSNSTHVDAGSGRRQSPVSAVSPSSLPVIPRETRKMSSSSSRALNSPPGNRKYVDSSIQTDPDESDAQFVPPPPSLGRPVFASLTQRLLKRCYADRVKLEEVQQQRPTSDDTGRNSVRSSISNASDSHRLGSSGISNNNDKGDVVMKDASDVTPPGARTRPPSQGSKDGDSESITPESRSGSSRPPLPPPWPSTLAHNTRIPRNGSKPRADLHVPLPSAPTSPAATSPGLATPSVMRSPLSTDPLPSQSGLQTPGSNATAPSPVKKKLSLGDYISRTGRTQPTPTSEKPPPLQVNAMPPPQKSPSQLHPNLSPSSLANSQRVEANRDDAEGAKHDDPTSSDVQMKDAREPTQPSQVTSVTL